MKKIQKFLLFLVISVCCFATDGQTATTKTATAKPSAEAWLTKKGRELLDILSIPETKKRYLKLRRIAHEVFSQKEMPRLAMGKYWKELTPEQQETLRTLFFDYFVVTYGSFNFDFSQISFKVTEKIPSGKDLLLRTKIKINEKKARDELNAMKNSLPNKENSQPVTTNSEDVEAFFALRETETGYYIRDAKFEGQSVMMFLRSQLESEYKNVLKSETFLKNMQEKINRQYRAAEDLDKMQKEKEKSN